MKDTNPYSSPTTARRPDAPNVTLLRRVRLATALTVPLAIGGVLITVIGMMRTLDATADGDSVEPSQLAGDISTSLIIGTISFPIAIVAFAIWLWATIKLRKLKRSAMIGSADTNADLGP